MQLNTATLHNHSNEPQTVWNGYRKGKYLLCCAILCYAVLSARSVACVSTDASALHLAPDERYIVKARQWYQFHVNVNVRLANHKLTALYAFAEARLCRSAIITHSNVVSTG